ncbi:hypothetical protein AQUCO_01400627v1 [Aquilegia coerulea]|uniref:Glutaredoxin domain-containing protein n=1 Tax=Aquilegia coerulea TaxID=218851 RepID=A0A2G5DXH2_AQUCA|nr:hypothetical protein AQUCO_01400627v1 [Aquilegia coerulea]
MANYDRFDNSVAKSTSTFGFDRAFSMKLSRDTIKKPFLDRFSSMKKPMVGGNDFIEGKVKKLCNSFEAALSKNLLKSKKKLLNGEEIDSSSSKKQQLSSKQFGLSRLSSIRLPGTEDRIVVYFTSLRGIRRTYEDCYTVRMILRGFRVPVDERDISMDSAYRKELLSVLGEKTVSLPRVFIRGKYVGGAEEIKQLHEGGELVKLLKGFPLRDPRLVCESCGDARFVPCLNCNGSRKIFCEEEDVMRRCLDCNENGLMRCPHCCN